MDRRNVLQLLTVVGMAPASLALAGGSKRDATQLLLARRTLAPKLTAYPWTHRRFATSTPRGLFLSVTFLLQKCRTTLSKDDMLRPNMAFLDRRVVASACTMFLDEFVRLWLGQAVNVFNVCLTGD
jgi:hypothetical protein